MEYGLYIFFRKGLILCELYLRYGTIQRKINYIFPFYYNFQDSSDFEAIIKDIKEKAAGGNDQLGSMLRGVRDKVAFGYLIINASCFCIFYGLEINRKSVS